MMFPDCPVNTPEACRFSTTNHVSTCMGWTPQYNRQGEDVSGGDPNLTTWMTDCAVCGRSWRSSRQYRQTTHQPDLAT